MKGPLRWLLPVMMALALACGFLHLLIAPDRVNFERLHIFLFNLCSGCTLLLYYSEGQPRLSRQGWLFLLLALLFSVSAFFKWYGLALLLPWPLALIVERVRLACFGHLWPRGLLSSREPVWRKFHQASLLGLTLALLLASGVLINQQFGPWLRLERFTLDTFFLGFSFPVSLIAMSVIFQSLEPAGQGSWLRQLAELSFWGVGAGVIVFFLFILAHLFVPQLIMASLLFLVVLVILLLYNRLGRPGQQKTFLTSGILFLLVTGITGILYIFYSFSQPYDPAQLKPLLKVHAFTSLYGWNLCGLAVICRRADFPIRLHSLRVNSLHWLTVLILCPLGYFYLPIALLALTCYVFLLSQFFFAESA